MVVGDFSIIDDLTLNNAIIKIMPGISINIEQGPSQVGELILDNCKLFSCVELWKGINLKVHQSSIKTLNYTHIEDAENAILSRNTQLTTLNISNTRFNRNQKGIVLENDIVMPKTAFVSKFYKNIFSCTKPLNGTTNGMTEIGVKLKNINYPFINNPLINGNHFKEIKNGIVAEGATSTVNVRESTFEKIIENGISFSGKKLSVYGSKFFTIGQFGIAWINSLELFAQLNIFTENPHSTSYPFRSMLYIQGPLPGSLFIVDQNTLSTAGILPAKIDGIMLLADIDHHFFKGSITKNTFNFFNESFPLGISSIAIETIGQFATEGHVTIENINKFNLTPDLLSSNVGIHMAILTNNVSCINNEFRSGAQYANLVSTGDCIGNKFIDNKFYPTPASFLSAGFRVENSFNLTVCSNKNFGASGAAYIFGHKNYNTTFSGNITYATDLQSNSLTLTDGNIPIQDQNPEMGAQPNAGNEWHPRVFFDPNTQSNFFVRSHLFHNSVDPGIIALSKFTISTAQSVWSPATGTYPFFTEYHPATDEIVPDSGPLANAFFDMSGTSEEVDCDVQFEPTPNLDPVDVHIANGTYNNLGNNPVKVWDAKRHLYRKLKLNPQYLNSYSAFNTFNQSETSSSIGKFYYVEKKIDESMSLGYTLDSLNNILKIQSQLLEEQAYDSSTLQTILAQKLIIDMQLIGIQNQYKIEQTARLNEANNILQTINPSAPVESYRKQILELFINAHLYQNGTLSESQIQLAKSIALLGVNGIGMTAFWAESLLPICELKPLLDSQTPPLQLGVDGRYDNKTNKIPLLNQTQTNVAIFPNPAIDFFTVSILDKDENGFLDVYSTSGKKVLSRAVNFGENTIDINLPNGLYAVRIHMRSGKFINTKLIVFK